MKVTSVLVTGANVGLGKECARQLSLMDGVEKVYLGCRNEEKAKAAKADLETSTGKSTFEIVIIDISDLDSVRKAVSEIKEPLDGLVLNAGGFGGPEFNKVNKDGVTNVMASNVLGHALLVDLLLEQKKLKEGCVVYAGSESARGFTAPGVSFDKPAVKTGSVEEMTSICDGSFDKETNPDNNDAYYGTVKFFAALWMASMARKAPNVRFVTISPGATSGTEGARDMPAVKKFILMNIGFPILKLTGNAHSVDVGAKHYVDALTGEETYKTGIFYGGAEIGSASGPVVDQVKFMPEFGKEDYQDNAYTAIHKFIK